MEELRPKTRSEIKHQKQNHSPVFIKTVEMDFLGWISKDLPASQEEELRQILYPGELLKKVHIKGSLLYIWCFFYERSHFLGFQCQIFFSDYETFTLSSALLNSQHPEGEVPPSALLVFFFDQHCIVKLHHLLQCSATSDSYKPPLDPLQLNLSDPNSLLLLGPLPPRAIPLPSACPTSSTSHSHSSSEYCAHPSANPYRCAIVIMPFLHYAAKECSQMDMEGTIFNY